MTADPADSTSATSSIALLTLLDGDAVLLRGDGRFALAEGVVLVPDDILEVPATGRLARLEFTDGATLALGPGSRALLAPRLGGARAGARAYLLSGWAKLGAPAATAAVAAGLLTPGVDAATTGGTLVMAVRPPVTQVFAEAGEIALRRDGAPPRTLKAGELLALPDAGGDGPPSAGRPTPAFVAAMPRAFQDALPARAARFRDRAVAPRRLGAIAYADAQPWLDAEPALRRAGLARWRPLARDPDFRRGLAANLRSHPEWGPVLAPPRNRPSP